MQQGQTAMPRRDFMGRVSTTGAAIAISVAADPLQAGEALALSGTGQRFELATAQVSDFTGRIGETFRLLTESGDCVDLTLVEATPVKASNWPSSFRQPFSLLFKGKEGQEVSSGIMTVRHHSLGEFPQTLNAVGPAEQFLVESIVA